ncbi:MAG: hypothetical protein GWN55_16210 [Phycisphaerae bacterium]|nr:hypothetical protein [Phycisphaerae bacterium]NIR67612.1 hypothetical protein [candidate division Zixibacteria bacterium]NIW49952.1 hypothetical protein [Gammaproteobacteria bacterium]NIP54176.1 hypothetical protein [Phycisphaerae bacterium]NIS53085.1 hypothetical protein [Phycisphaerae bacterium]
MADKYWRGGAYTLRGQGTAASDGDWNYDDTGGGSNSNWVDASGSAVAKPVTGTDKVFLTELADRVPSTYSNSSYPHTAGGHWCITDNLDQSALDLNGFFVSANYEGHIYGLKTRSLLAKAAQDQGGGIVRIRHSGALLAVGDYSTIGGTVSYNGEFRVQAAANDGTDNYIHIKATYVAETFETDDTITARTPLQVSIADTYDMIIESNGTFYIECGSTTPNIPELIFNSTSGLLHISSEAANANWDDIRVTGGGTLTIARDTYFTKLTTTGEATAAIINVGKDCIGPSSASCDLDCFASTITWDSKIGDVEQHGGTITYCQNVSTGTTVDIDKWLIYAGKANLYGKFSLKDYEQWGGTITAKGDGAKTIGSAATSYKQHGGTFDMSQATGPVSFYSGASIDHKGGDLKPAKRTTVSW